MYSWRLSCGCNNSSGTIHYAPRTIGTKVFCDQHGLSSVVWISDSLIKRQGR